MSDAPGSGLAWMRRWYTPVTAAGLTLLSLVAVFRMESSAPNYDPQYMRVLVERTMRDGGSYYSNGIHNKGPLEPLVYEIAGQIGGPDGWWLVISAFAFVLAVAVGVAAAVVAVRAGSPTIGAACVATMVVVHLTLSDADYAGVLYARNLTTALLAVAVGAVAYGPWWADEHSRRRTVLVVGVTTGLAVQTLLTACFTASPILLWAMWERRHDRVWGRPAPIVLPLISAGAFVSAPLGYAAFGPWQDFVDGYWTYARFMSSGTGRSLSGQFDLGWTRFTEYYRDRWVIALVLASAAVITSFRWRRLDRAGKGLRVVVACWWFGAWVEMVLSQRYSSHYFSIIAVPTLMVVAVLAGDVLSLVRRGLDRRPAWRLLPLVVAVVTVQIGGQSGFDVGVDTLSSVDSTADFAVRRERGLDGRIRMTRAALDLVSDDGDPVLAWTSYPWTYLDLRRTSATRYIWKSFLLGEIYLGRTSQEYVLPGTWDRFRSDLDETDPMAYVVETVNPIDPTTPFRDEVDERFATVFADEAVTLGFRRDLVDWLQGAASDAVALASPGERTADGPVTVSTDRCVRVDGEIPHESVLSVQFTGATHASITATVGATRAIVESWRFGVAGHVTERRLVGDRSSVSVIVGARSAVVVLDGRIVGAVELQPGTPVVISSGFDQLVATGSVVSRPPAFTGC